MKKMLIMLLFAVSISAFAQEANTGANPVGNEPLLQEFTDLKELSKKVNDAQAEVALSATGSRTQGETAQQHLKTACTDYLAALQAKLEEVKSDSTLTEALNREITATRKLVPAEEKSTR